VYLYAGFVVKKYIDNKLKEVMQDYSYQKIKRVSTPLMLSSNLEKPIKEKAIAKHRSIFLK